MLWPLAGSNVSARRAGRGIDPGRGASGSRAGYNVPFKEINPGTGTTPPGVGAALNASPGFVVDRGELPTSMDCKSLTAITAHGKLTGSTIVGCESRLPTVFCRPPNHWVNSVLRRPDAAEEVQQRSAATTRIAVSVRMRTDGQRPTKMCHATITGFAIRAFELCGWS